MKISETPYEKAQNLNHITSFLHSTRYKNLNKLAGSLRPKYGEKLRVLDIGCGPAKNFSVLNSLRDDIDYIGIEIREDFSSVAEERYSRHENFKIVCDDIQNQFALIKDFDLIIGMESFEHIPESLVVRIIECIGSSEFQYLYITIPNEVGPAILLKNTGSFLMGYSRYKEYTWKETFYASIYELDKVARHTIGHKGFDWRWLAQTLRQNVSIKKITTSPYQIIPKFISPSIGFICVK